MPLCLRWVCGLGFCAITWPFFTFLEKACPTLPTEQKCALTALFAALRLLPSTFGTTHFLAVNLALTDSGAFTVTLQVLFLPLQAPDQPEKVDPLAAFAVKVTDVPCGNPCEHVRPQLIPAGALLTRPEPLPLLWTVRSSAGGGV